MWSWLFGWLRPRRRPPQIEPASDVPPQLPVPPSPEPEVIETVAADTIVELATPPAQPEPEPPVPLEIPRAGGPPPGAEAAVRARAGYFTPARYAGASASPFLLSPDLLFQLRREPPRLLAAPEGFAGPQTPRADSAYFAAPLPPPPPPVRTVPGAVLTIDPTQLAAFFAHREDSPAVALDAALRYLTEPVLLSIAIALRDQVLENRSTGKPPLGPRALFEEARSLVPHTGTALLLCHNVAKAFSRGGAAIPWLKVDRLRGEYSDGRNNFAAGSVCGPAGMLNPSIFYALFSPSELGAADPGDWYRFFATATMAWYAASGQLRSAATDLARRMADQLQPSTAEDRAWAWVNAVSFTEYAIYGRSQKRVAAASRVDQRGAALGIAETGRQPTDTWRWYVSRAAAWAGRLQAPADWTPAISETLDATGAAVP